VIQGRRGSPEITQSDIGFSETIRVVAKNWYE
jgi:hypothetical protein